MSEVSPLINKIKDFPSSSGVYLMKDSTGKIIYIGKAKNLKNRVKQYFGDQDSRFQIDFLMRRVCEIDTLVTSNEHEALLLENSLIKKHKPRYNVFLKDDKTYVSLRLGLDHHFPRLTVTRKIRKDGAKYYGPYSSAESCRATVDFIYRNFKLRTCSDHEFSNRSRPCLEYQMNRCTAPCVGKVSRSQYALQIAPVQHFLEGNDTQLKKMVRENMQYASEQENYEEAAGWRDLLKNIEVMLEKQQVVRHGGKHQDVVGYYRVDSKVVICVLHIQEGVLIDSHTHKITSHDTDKDLLSQFLNQHYLDSLMLPSEIIVPDLKCDTSVLEDVLTEKKGEKLRITTPQKGDKKSLMELAVRNARSQYEKSTEKALQREELLKNLQRCLDLTSVPYRIECYDISNISGRFPTASRVVFMGGVPDKKLYRHYKIKMDEGPNDVAMMREVLMRRFGNSPQPPLKIREGEANPDLIVLDGGKGQLNMALAVLKELHLDIPAIGIAKGRGGGARGKGLWEGKKEEEIYLPKRKNPLILKRGSPELMLLQQIRDESHRFAIKYHRKLRDTVHVIPRLAVVSAPLYGVRRSKNHNGFPG